MSIFNGIATAIVTPFDKNGIDTIALQRQIEFQITSGVSAIVVLGTTGEPIALSHDERIRMIEYTVRYVDGRVPIIVGTGSNDTMQAVVYAMQAQELGANALLVVTPYYNKCSNKGLLMHYAKIASSVSIPIIAYSVPTRTNVHIPPSTLSRLATIDNIVALKDASGSLTQVLDYGKVLPAGFDIYCGDDDLTLPYMAQGAKGTISVLSNIIPSDMVYVYNQCAKGAYHLALERYRDIRLLSRHIFKLVNPIGIKTALMLLHMDSGIMRLPLCKMPYHSRLSLHKQLKIYLDKQGVLYE